MTKVLTVLIALAFSLQAQAEVGDIPDPDTWYRDGYAPLWSTNPGEQVAAMLNYYSDIVETHSVGGEITLDNKQEWLAEPMQQWLSEGWLSSDLKQLTTDRINDSTAVFKASWADHYQGAPDEMSCGWYLADYIDGRWQFTVYADIDCAAHGL